MADTPKTETVAKAEPTAQERAAAEAARAKRDFEKAEAEAKARAKLEAANAKTGGAAASAPADDSKATKIVKAEADQAKADQARDQALRDAKSAYEKAEADVATAETALKTAPDNKDLQTAVANAKSARDAAKTKFDTLQKAQPAPGKDSGGGFMDWLKGLFTGGRGIGALLGGGLLAFFGSSLISGIFGGGTLVSIALAIPLFMLGAKFFGDLSEGMFGGNKDQTGAQVSTPGRQVNGPDKRVAIVLTREGLTNILDVAASTTGMRTDAIKVQENANGRITFLPLEGTNTSPVPAGGVLLRDLVNISGSQSLDADFLFTPKPGQTGYAVSAQRRATVRQSAAPAAEPTPAPAKAAAPATSTNVEPGIAERIRQALPSGWNTKPQLYPNYDTDGHLPGTPGYPAGMSGVGTRAR